MISIIMRNDLMREVSDKANRKLHWRVFQTCLLTFSWRWRLTPTFWR